jgi:hypothetical protein
MRHKADFPVQEGARVTIANRDILLYTYMTWCYFRAPVSNLQHRMEDGGMAIIDVAAKFHAISTKILVSKKREWVADC